MKKVASIFLFAVLLTGTVLADDDGHTSGGGKAADPPCTLNCPDSFARQAPSATGTTDATDTEAVEPSYFEYFKEVFLDMFV